ncbi:DUF305 domain-containing protein [Streptomyces sp. NPDC048623]|uniref:DUF305 domain-containing protein n=1 Tax=Streptomyces sp. NPDC048623 TaxID=3155761 RepID=UPI00343AD099
MRALKNVKNSPARSATRRTARRLAVTGAVAAAGLLLAACGGSDGGSMSGMDHGGMTSAPAASVPAGAGASAGSFNDADVMFAQMMIPHHEQALEMAKLADGRAEDAEIKKIVGAIEKAQDPEIQKMQSWLKAWGRPEAMEGGSGHSMGGMMSDTEMKDLAAAKGKEFDRTFAELMIAHHEGAVSMAKTEQTSGADPEAKKVADDVVRTQTAEITQLKQILARL